MNPEQVTGMIRQFLPFVSGIATALGLTWFDGVASAVLATIGPVGALASLVWSLVNKKQGNIVAMAAAVPSVKAIEMSNTAEGRAIAAPGVTPDNVTVSPVTPAAGPIGTGSMRR